MALSFLSRRAKKGDQLVAIDLGGRTTKAVLIQNKDGSPSLLGYTLLDAPIYEKSLSPELLTEHLKLIVQALDAKTKTVSLAIGVNDSVVRQAEMPQIPISDMRMILKNNSKNYLQQDLPGYVFDCHVIPPREGAKPAEGTPKPAGATPKLKVLAGGARSQLITDLQTAVRDAHLNAEMIVPALTGPVNAFELTMPEIFSREVVALVEIGFKNSTICILDQGDLALTRVVAIGGDKMTASLAESLSISYAEAEGIKVGMPTEVQADLKNTISPLGRELRASIDFFEHQHDRPVSQIFVSGGSARSEFILQSLQEELIAKCSSWNPTGFLQLSLPPQQLAEIEHVAPQLTVAVGTAVAYFD